MLKNSITLLAILICAAAIHAQPGHSIYRDTFCGNQTILVGNQFFDQLNPSGTVTLPGAAQGGIDSVIHVDLAFLQFKEVTLNQTLCEGDTLWVNGRAYHAGFFLGEEFIDGGAANGCDSLIHVQLTFRQVFFDFQPIICEGNTVMVNGHVYDAFNTEGMEVFANGGCDSIVHVQVTALPLPYGELTDTLCPDAFMVFNGTRYDKGNPNGLEILHHASAAGRDSLLLIHLSFTEIWLYLGEDVELIKGDALCVEPQFGLVPVSLVWSPTQPCTDSTCQNHCIVPVEPISFTLTATDTMGCVVKDELNIRISDKNRVYGPTAFSPDADKPNDRFFLFADRGVVLIRRLILADRWGEVLFEKRDFLPDDYESGWNGYYRGRVMPPAAYVYWAELERLDGTTFEKSGVFSLIR